MPDKRPASGPATGVCSQEELVHSYPPLWCQPSKSGLPPVYGCSVYTFSFYTRGAKARRRCNFFTDSTDLLLLLFTGAEKHQLLTAASREMGISLLHNTPGLLTVRACAHSTTRYDPNVCVHSSV
jgi:hypothetical protein